MSETTISPNAENSDYPTPYAPPTKLGGVHGEFGAESGPKLPVLKLIQKVGESSVKYPKDMGGLLYESTIVPRPATISFYGFHGYYQQNLAFDVNVLPQRFGTIAEVEQAGGNVTPFVRPGVDSNNYIPAGICFLLIHAPNGAKSWAKDVQAACGYEEGKTKSLLLPAMWYLRSTAYRIITPLVQRLAKDGDRDNKKLCQARYELDTQQTLVGSNYVYIPVVKRLAEDNSEKFATFAQAEIFGD